MEAVQGQSFHRTAFSFFSFDGFFGARFNRVRCLHVGMHIALVGRSVAGSYRANENAADWRTYANDAYASVAAYDFIIMMDDERKSSSETAKDLLTQSKERRRRVESSRCSCVTLWRGGGGAIQANIMKITTEESKTLSCYSNQYRWRERETTRQPRPSSSKEVQSWNWLWGKSFITHLSWVDAFSHPCFAIKEPISAQRPSGILFFYGDFFFRGYNNKKSTFSVGNLLCR